MKKLPKPWMKSLNKILIRLITSHLKALIGWKHNIKLLKGRELGVKAPLEVLKLIPMSLNGLVISLIVYH